MSPSRSSRCWWPQAKQHTRIKQSICKKSHVFFSKQRAPLPTKESTSKRPTQQQTTKHRCTFRSPPSPPVKSVPFKRVSLFLHSKHDVHHPAPGPCARGRHPRALNPKPLSTPTHTRAKPLPPPLCCTSKRHRSRNTQKKKSLKKIIILLFRFLGVIIIPFPRSAVISFARPRRWV